MSRTLLHGAFRGRAAAFGLASALVSGAVAASFAGCGGGPGRVRDVAGDRRRGGREASGTDAGNVNVVPEAPATVDASTAATVKPRILAHASARALAVDDDRVFYGDSEDDGVYSMPKAGGEPLRIARHAPVAGALALVGGFVTWIASPGDAVLRAPLGGVTQPTTLREHGIFSDVAASGDHVFITEAIGAGGALLRVTGGISTRLAAFDGPPRAVMADATHAFVVTPAAILRTPHLHGDLETIGTGSRFSHAELDDAFVYVVAEIERGRVVVRFPKTGGTAETIARDVRDAPIDVDGGELFYFDGTRPQLRSVPTGGGTPRVVAEDEGLLAVSAIETDANAVYVAEGVHESGVIVAIARR